MARKRPELDPEKAANIFGKTESAEVVKPKRQKRGRPRVLESTSPVGVTLEADELDRLDEMAAEIGVSRHALLVYAIRFYMKAWESGERPKTRKRVVEELDI